MNGFFFFLFYLDWIVCARALRFGSGSGSGSGLMVNFAILLTPLLLLVCCSCVLLLPSSLFSCVLLSLSVAW